MFNSEKNIFLLETEIKPNKSATLVLVFLFTGMVFSWFLNEIGIFRVGKWEMRIGTSVPLVFVIILTVLLLVKKELSENPKTKWYIFAVSVLVTISINTLLNFHTTIMLLFPIFIAMLYKSKGLGIAATISSVLCTALSPVLGYLLHVWDVPLLKELLLISTNATVILEGATNELKLLSVLKILLYLVLPRLIMVGSCSLLMFRVIKIGAEHVDTQIKLDIFNHQDMLTGLYNQNYFKQILEKQLAGPVGLIMFDVNGLKNANDTYGHEHGDTLLINCAKSLKAVLDEKTVAFRIGGDEFLLIIEDGDSDKVALKLQEWKTAIKNINDKNAYEFGNNFCSMAAGGVSGDLKNINELLRDADAVMYQNKAEMKKI